MAAFHITVDTDLQESILNFARSCGTNSVMSIIYWQSIDIAAQWSESCCSESVPVRCIRCSKRRVWFVIVWRIMSSLKSVIITLPKGLPKAIPRNELTRNALSHLNLAASIRANKARMDARKAKQQREEPYDNDVTMIAKPEICARGKKSRLDHLTWEEKLQRKWVKRDNVITEVNVWATFVAAMILLIWIGFG